VRRVLDPGAGRRRAIDLRWRRRRARPLLRSKILLARRARACRIDKAEPVAAAAN